MVAKGRHPRKTTLAVATGFVFIIIWNQLATLRLQQWQRTMLVSPQQIQPVHDSMLPKVMAIYFPQYHQDPLNDRNWGEGFTDWKNLNASRPENRLGFPIPRPTELGYYDLTDTGVRDKQGILAREYDIDGFIYHHYWFYDRSHPGPNLAAPLLRMLEDGKPDMPFFLNWCADSWFNVWMGKAINQTKPTNKTAPIAIQEQFFNPTDEMIVEHYRWLAQFFHHKNYIKIDNQPVFMLYKNNEQALPILKRLRQHAQDDGLDGLYFVVGRRAAPDHIYSNVTEEEGRMKERRTEPIVAISMDVFNQSMTYPYPLPYVSAEYQVPQWCIDGTKREHQFPGSRQEITGILSSFDNTPRREFETSNIYSADTPKNNMALFRANLYATLTFNSCCQQLTDDRFVAINAWNEWAEGMALEPSHVYGRGFLEIIRDVKAQVQEERCNFKAHNS